MTFRWPRGKYNGRRIQGIKVSLAVHILEWRWRPAVSLNFGEPYLIWLCFTVRFSCEYSAMATP